MNTVTLRDLRANMKTYFDEIDKNKDVLIVSLFMFSILLRSFKIFSLTLIAILYLLCRNFCLIKDKKYLD